MNKFNFLLSIITPGLSQIAQKRYLTGVVIFLIFISIISVSSIIAGSPYFPKLFVFNPLLILFYTILKKSWTTGFSIFIIATFIGWIFTIFEAYLWQKSK